MATQPQPISKIPSPAVAADGYLTPLAEIPTPGPSPSSTPALAPAAAKNKDLPPTPPSSSTPTPSPCETDPNLLPDSDPFRDMPLYGRYAPSPTDFHPDPAHIQSTSPASIAHWENLLKDYCNEDTLMLSPVDDDSAIALGRWIFAIGSVVIKTNHLAPAGRRRRDYSGVDRNEVEAIRLVKERVIAAGKTDIRVPQVYFQGKLLGGDVLVQERLPGVSLEVAWPYLSRERKEALMRQARSFLIALLDVGVSPSGRRAYVVDDYNAIWARALTPRERKLMLPPPPAPGGGGRVGIGWGVQKRKDSAVSAAEEGASAASPRFSTSLREAGVPGGVFDDGGSSDEEYSLEHPDSDTRFTHNDMSTGNIIIDDDRIVGVVDWEHAGWIGWRTAALLHKEVRAPLPEMFDRKEFASDEEWEDAFLWKKLYDGISP
ncbi:hypothetical protein B0J12DRAFT_80290 [Macrophomina phaseolina]|uniref:Aminoglycoside phosphotransferase domain-containing protein n=1 Tax=Macrophomina phaseolina TaxID=35725 RepID=A0ABQ8GEE0_9PEZI|nr:hypothetical protein B0J12DRAFT_80290 [Macrophomina phaseolina]